ncbi:trypsin-like peptidase domain-containing protein [Saccharopolyspora sp. K220]|uniref:nSTAND1 domain-containing NTPase n=1 Tax=Saccharopolyspora soli TaxID=2926618 RepID=UPI001F5630C5|nr:trypsin-like peptidase domain-containing protein [Saccharopolyspora soli]MCI2419043.1 trypsin-like peptidase domain-containing protein [Saccharopolyspora soli]
MSGLAADPLDPAVVRLRDGPHVLGAGFLIAPEVIATCAHVIGDATEPVADFPLLRSADHAVEVLERNHELDVAILRLVDPPPGALPVPARITGGVRDHRFRTFGFPRDLPDGIWVTGRLLGAQGAGRIQMAVDPDHWHIEPGFSGAPVWDEELAGVVGMVVTTAARNETTAHLVPTTALGDAWTTPARNPYRGLRPFQEEDAELFHGRDADIDRLVQLAAQQEIVAIAGPSGSGKSSLVRAGLLPRLKQAGADVVDLGQTDDIPTTPGTVLVLDQFEETVIADPAAAREKLAAVSKAVATQQRRAGEPAPLRAVLTLRSRSLDDLISRETVAELNRAVWFLEPMSREQLAAAIEKPAAVVGGLAFESGLVQRILDDTADEPGTLPLVSLVLDQLWQHRHGGWLTHEAYESIGRVPGALSNAADEALRSLNPRQREGARQLLTRLTRHDGEGGYARRSVQLTDLDPELRETAHDLASKRLVVIQDQRVNLTHQALIDHWPQLREWLTEDADFLTWQAKIQDLESSGVLLRDAVLAEATGWLGEREEDIPAQQRSFIRRSIAAQRRNQRRWRTISAVLAVLTLLSAVLTGAVITSASEVSSQLRATNSTLIAQQANLATEASPGVALQLALAAWRENPDGPDAYGALLQQRMLWNGVNRVLPPQLLGDVTTLHSSADGRVVVTEPADPAAKVAVWWNLLGPNPIHREVTPESGNEFVLSPDGRMLAASGEDAGLRMWDLTDPAGEPIVLDSQLDFAPPTFSANGRYLAALPRGLGEPLRSPVRAWDLGSMRELPSQVIFERTYESASISEAYPSPDGRALVILEPRTNDQGDFVYRTVVRDRETGAEIRTFAPFTDLGGELLGNGTRLGVCTDNTLTVLDSFTGATTAQQIPLPGCWFKPDASGQYLLVPSRTGAGAVPWRTGIPHVFRDLDVENPLISGDSVVVAEPDGTGSILSLRGTGTLQVVEATPDDHFEATGPSPTSPLLTARTADGQRWITFTQSEDNYESGELALLDSRGNALARTHISPWPSGIAFDASGERVLLVTGATLRILRADGLVPEREVQLPLPEGRHASEVSDRTGASVLTAPTGETLVSQAGILSYWDIRTGTQTAPTLTLQTPLDRPARLPVGPNITLRPQHPEQILVRSDESLAAWDFRNRTLQREFPMPLILSNPDPPVVSSDGSVAAALDGVAVSLVNLDDGETFPRVNGEFDELVGISGDYLFTGNLAAFEAWDWSARRRVASVRLADPDAPLAVVGNELVTNVPGRRTAIPLDPEAWFRDLCRMSNREFTDQEKELLPAGASTEPPCE